MATQKDYEELESDLPLFFEWQRIENPRWPGQRIPNGTFHGHWEYFVSDKHRENWGRYSLDQKVLLYAVAEMRASQRSHSHPG